jgi:2-polyprenyl-3-methyl-5-hydroxy-6-metoxy-1,4-benzoquinol methylase
MTPSPVPRPAAFDDPAIPMIATEAVPNCPLCGMSAFHGFAEGYDYELRSCRNRWRFVQCDSCGHVWLNPRPALSTLGTIYPPTYYAYNYAARINPVAVKAKEMLDGAKMRAILGHLSRPPRSFLDVGCGDGRFLKVMAKRGVARDRNYGLELNEAVLAPLRADGYQVACERVEDCTFIPDGSLDLVTMFHVIEHVDDPGPVIRKLARWMAPGGVLALETPNLDSLDQRLFHESYWGGYHIPRHWNLYTASTLARQLKDAGLEPVATIYQTGHSFWMYSVHHWMRYEGTPRPRLAKLFDPIGSLAFLAAFTAWDKLRGALGFRTSAVLMLARKPVA